MTEKTTTTTKKKRNRKPTHNTYTARRILRVAELAWRGASICETADELGVPSRYVSSVASYYHIRFSPKKSTADVSELVGLRRKTRDALVAIGTRHDMDLPNLMTTLLTALAGEPTLIANLISEE